MFEPMFQTFHAGPITGMDMCIRKQLIATCGLDKTVRIWNYADWTLEQSMVCPRQAPAVACGFSRTAAARSVCVCVLHR